MSSKDKANIGCEAWLGQGNGAQRSKRLTRQRLNSGTGTLLGRFIQSGRQGVGINNFTPFCMSSDKEKRDAVVATVRGHEHE